MKRAIISSGVKLYGLSPEEIERVKESLTFQNPAYRNAKRYSKYAYTTIPPYLAYYNETKGYVEVPVGYDLTSLRLDEIKDERVYEQIKTPPFVLELRNDQETASNEYLKHNATSCLMGSIQMPTGKGKSILGLHLASVLSTKTLVVVHKNDLVTGWEKDIELAFGGKVKSGLIKAQSRKVGDFITIATVQTLSRMSEEELQGLFNQFGFVIQDEMHHCPASTFGVVSRFNARYRLGLSATPERTDGLTHVMKLYYGSFCYVFEHTESDEDILPVKVIVRKHDLYFDPKCKNVEGRYEIEDFACPKNVIMTGAFRRLSEIPHFRRPKIYYHSVDDFVVRGIADFVLGDILSEYTKGRSCVVFFTQKEHCRLYYDLLKETVPESDLGLYYGDNPNNEDVLNQAEKQRKFITLTTYAKATEGTNVKQWEVEFLVSSINNEKNTEQALGRIRRTKEGHKISPVLVYDYRTPNVYSFAYHGLTRDKRYRALKCTFEGVERKTTSLFTRGYK